MANKVPATLAPESTQWGRSVEQRLRDGEVAQSQLGTSGQTNNARVSSILRSSKRSKNSSNFLNNQISYGYAPNAFNVTNVTASVNPYAYNEQYDASVTFTTSSTGKFLIQGSGQTESNATSVTGYIYYRFELLDSNGVRQWITDGGISRLWNGSDISMPGFRMIRVEGFSNTQYTVRLRRALTIVSGTLLSGTWSLSNLTVTLLGN